MTDPTDKYLLIGTERVSSVITLSHSPSERLTIPMLVAVARGDDQGNLARVELDPESLERCRRSAEYIEKAVLKAEEIASKTENDVEPDHRDLIYGVNTGFGNNRDKPIHSYRDACRLSENILFSHQSAVGTPLPTEIVRATMLLRLRTFVEGRSGIRPELVILMKEMLNRKVHPLVPSQGSLGSSGDLPQLAHIGVVLIGAGQAYHEPDYPLSENKAEDILTGREALESAGLKPPEPPRANSEISEDDPILAPKEGLALTNGAAVSAALTAIAAFDTRLILHTANLTGSLTLQAVGGFSRAFDEKPQLARPHPGQIECAAEVRKFIEGSELINKAAPGHHQQDEYSIRAIPQVHGAALNALKHVEEVISIEINSATDNPLIFIEPDDPVDERSDSDDVSFWQAYSAANFHGEPIGMVADYLKIAVAELGSISERRSQLLMDPHHNRGLPVNLSGGKGGLDSGMMLYQYMAASLVSENKVLSHPATVDSIPTSANVEDHNAMSTIAARHLSIIVQNVSKVIAVELLAAIQALDFRTGGDFPLLSHKGLPLPGKFNQNNTAKKIRKLIREGTEGFEPVPFIERDTGYRDNVPGSHIERTARIILSGTILRQIS